MDKTFHTFDPHQVLLGAEAYRRLLDASTRSFNYAYELAHLQREAGRAAHQLPLASSPRRRRSAANSYSSARCTAYGCAAHGCRRGGHGSEVSETVAGTGAGTGG
ncbi:hypothetical protein [Streptomyces coelicoflavus]|uniref:hypothetical protein n=1 Tax=Streptomyces coelicoflavus TaxID=285562 RepID=UPI0036C7D445